jgi:hypothetical protein
LILCFAVNAQAQRNTYETKEEGRKCRQRHHLINSDAEGNGTENAVMKIYNGEIKSLQITFYERESEGLGLSVAILRGKVKRVSTRTTKSKGKKFDKFWKTFVNK